MLVLESEQATAVFMDSCIYDHFSDGRNAVERYFAEHPPAPGSNKELVSQAMIRARYRLLETTRLEEGIGMWVRGSTEDETFLQVLRPALTRG